MPYKTSIRVGKTVSLRVLSRAARLYLCPFWALGISSVSALLPCGIVVEPSPLKGAWLLIAQSPRFFAVAFAVSGCAVARRALRGFQQLTEFFTDAFLCQATFKQANTSSFAASKSLLISYARITRSEMLR